MMLFCSFLLKGNSEAYRLWLVKHMEMPIKSMNTSDL